MGGGEVSAEREDRPQTCLLHPLSLSMRGVKQGLVPTTPDLNELFYQAFAVLQFGRLLFF